MYYPYINQKTMLNLPKLTDANLLVVTLICANDKEKLNLIKDDLQKLILHKDDKIRKISDNLLKVIME